MEFDAIVAGTGFEGRDARIRRFAKDGAPVLLRREPDNPYDPNAVAVYLPVKRWYTLFQEVDLQIGYIKRARAASLAEKLDNGAVVVSARIKSMYKAQKHPRVSLRIDIDE